MTIDTLKALQRLCIDSEGGPLFLGLPDRWLGSPRFRCVNGHVSARVLTGEAGHDRCLACRAPALLTFPEDTETPELTA